MQENSGMIISRMRIDKEKFGKFIAERREKIRGIHTQILLAKRLSVSKGTIGKIETGERMPSFELFIDLADALQMTPGELMMVLAERENGDKNYMEMNDWLFEKIANVIDEYKKIRNPVTHELPYHNPIPTTPAMEAEIPEVDKSVDEENPPQTNENITQEENQGEKEKD